MPDKKKSAFNQKNVIMNAMKNRIFLLFFFPIILAGCSLKETDETAAPDSENTRLVISFTGDIMAHDVNFRLKDFKKMYENISHFLLQDDLSFGNLEFPVDDTQPYSTFPAFNVNTPYVEALIDAGFDVFSLSNNHTIDKGTGGITGTNNAMKALREKYLKNIPPRRITYNGTKKNYFDGFKVSVFYKNGLKIAFLSVTEILNNYSNARFKVQYYDYTETMKEEFAEKIKTIKEEIQPDLFITAIHISEPEYVREVKESRKEYFRKLADSGADIIWAHHPHVAQEWEIYQSRYRTGQTLIMYSMGNFISGQRYRANLSNPGAAREYTGDSLILQAEIEKTPGSSGIYINVNPILITTKVDYSSGEITLHHFTEEFIDAQDDLWKPYYRARFNLMKDQFGDLFPWEKIQD